MCNFLSHLHEHTLGRRLSLFLSSKLCRVLIFPKVFSLQTAWQRETPGKQESAMPLRDEGVEDEGDTVNERVREKL